MGNPRCGGRFPIKPWTKNRKKRKSGGVLAIHPNHKPKYSHTAFNRLFRGYGFLRNPIRKPVPRPAPSGYTGIAADRQRFILTGQGLYIYPQAPGGSWAS